MKFWLRFHSFIIIILSFKWSNSMTSLEKYLDMQIDLATPEFKI